MMKVMTFGLSQLKSIFIMKIIGQGHLARLSIFLERLICPHYPQREMPVGLTQFPQLWNILSRLQQMLLGHLGNMWQVIMRDIFPHFVSTIQVDLSEVARHFQLCKV